MRSALLRPVTLVAVAVLIDLAVLGSVSLLAEPQAPPQVQPSNALPATRTGADIYQAACLTCHGRDGRGAPKNVVGFDRQPRDFTNCTATAETTSDWMAVVHEGGPIRGLDKHMPAFGDALSAEDIERVVGYIRTFCTDLPRWPIGDLNFPRAFFTEKAFPENETRLTTGVSTGAEGPVSNTLVYEHRVGARNQIEVVVPIDFQENTDIGPNGPWVAGIGDLAVAFRRTFLASARTGTIAAAGVEVALPIGNEYKGLGNGYAIYEAFGMWGQALPHDSFLQMHGGVEFPSDSLKGSKESYLRTAIGTTLTQNHGFGRSWSPQVELLWAKPFGAPAAYDLVPQLQVSLSKLQHVLLSGGVRVPINEREERRPELLIYLLWDWFDGGLFSFWK